MEKLFYKRVEDRNEEEKRTGYASYKSVVDRYNDKRLLCNEIINVDESVERNMEYPENYGTDNVDIFQYFLTDCTEYEKNKLLECGCIMSYSKMLDLYVLCVDHLGTSWDYVDTGLKLTEEIENTL